MFRTTQKKLIKHLKEELGLVSNSIVWLHSGVRGLGIIEEGIHTITGAFEEVLSEGALVIPTFTYSWCKGKIYNSESTECNDMGGYASQAWKDDRFARNQNPNFSVAVMDNTHNGMVKATLIQDQTTWSCFGKGSAFDLIDQISADSTGYIILLGGAHDDVVFRSTFLHHVEEKVSVPYRYLKYFKNPENSHHAVSQYVRYLTRNEFIENNGIDSNIHYKFPIIEKYIKLGEDLIREGLIIKIPFGYSETRMVNIHQFCVWLEKKIISDPEYLLR